MAQIEPGDAQEEQRDQERRAAEREQPIPGPWEANARDGTLKVRGPATAKKYKQREVCRMYGANRATVDLIVASPDLFAAIAEPIPSALPGGTFADDLVTLAGIIGETPYKEVGAKLLAKAAQMRAALAKAKGGA